VAREHRVEQHAERPHVDGSAEVLLPLRDLGRHVRRRAAEDAQPLVRVAHHDGEAKVRQLRNLLLVVEDHVLEPAQRGVGAGGL
jgi:hypothetical protein